MKLGIRLFLVTFLAATVGPACPENVGTVTIQLVQPPTGRRPLDGVRQLTLRVERDGRFVKERTFSSRDEFELGEVGPISNAYLVVEGKTSVGETRRGKAGPIDLGASRGHNPLVVNLFLGDVEAFSPFARISSMRAYHATATLPGGDVLITGGEIVEPSGQATKSVGLYEILGAQSFELVALQSRVGFSPNPRSQHTATVLDDGRVVLIGGANKQPLSAEPENGRLLYDAEILDPREALPQLGREPRLSFARRQHTATLLGDGTILVAGGFAATPAKTDLPGKVAPYKDESSGEWVGSAELMDLSAGTTTAIVENGMICPRAGHTAMLVAGVNVVVLAGGVDEKGRPTDCVELYYPDQRRFEVATLTPLDGQSVWVGRSGMAAMYLPSIERLAFFGGYRWVPGPAAADPGRVEPVNFVDLLSFDQASRKIAGFERIIIPDRIGEEEVTTAARANMKAVNLRDGRILLVGGEGDPFVPSGQKYGQILPVTDWMYFSPETREVSFSFTVHPQARRNGHTVDILPNGEVVLIGGEVSSLGSSTLAHTDLVEWYTPKE